MVKPLAAEVLLPLRIAAYQQLFSTESILWRRSWDADADGFNGATNPLRAKCILNEEIAARPPASESTNGELLLTETTTLASLGAGAADGALEDKTYTTNFSLLVVVPPPRRRRQRRRRRKSSGATTSSSWSSVENNRPTNQPTRQESMGVRPISATTMKISRDGPTARLRRRKRRVIDSLVTEIFSNVLISDNQHVLLQVYLIHALGRV